MSTDKILIRSNTYDVPERLKCIDKGYFVVFNLSKNKYEVHNEDNIGSSYCFTVPYDELDSRTVELCKRTNVSLHGDEIFKMIDRENARLEAEKKKKFADEIEARARYSRPLFAKAAFESGL